MPSIALVFDLDGTLYDSSAIDEQNKQAAIAAVSHDKKISFDCARDLLTKQKTLGSKSTSQALRDLNVSDITVRKYQLNMINPEKHIRQDAELANLIREIRKSFKIILLTNTRREVVNKILYLISLNQNDFDLILGGGDFLDPKPSVASLKFSLDSVRCTPIGSYTIGDRWAVDHEPGKMLGMQSVLVAGRDQLVEWLKTKISSQIM